MNIGDAGRAGPQFVAAGDTVYSRKNFPPDIKSLICGIYGRRDGMIKVTYLGKWFRGPQSPRGNDATPRLKIPTHAIHLDFLSLPYNYQYIIFNKNYLNLALSRRVYASANKL